MSEKFAQIKFQYWNEETNYGVWEIEIFGLEDDVNIKGFSLEQLESNFNITLERIGFIQGKSNLNSKIFTVNSNNKHKTNQVRNESNAGSTFFLICYSHSNLIIDDVKINFPLKFEPIE